MATPLNVLVCGANGFIGSRIVAALLQAGHRVSCGSATRLRTDLPHLPIDYARDTASRHLAAAPARPRHGRQRRRRAARQRAPADAARCTPPCRPRSSRPARKPACAASSRSRPWASAAATHDNPTQYAHTKRAAEAALEALPAGGPSWIALRPSVVLGPGGDAAPAFPHAGRASRCSRCPAPRSTPSSSRSTSRTWPAPWRCWPIRPRPTAAWWSSAARAR